MRFAFNVLLLLCSLAAPMAARADGETSGSSGSTPTLQGSTLKNETRVFYGDCSQQFGKKIQGPGPSVEFMPPGVGAELALGAATSLVDIGAAALKASVAESSSNAISPFPANNWVYTISWDNEKKLFTAQLKSSCVQVIRGEFSPKPTTALDPACAKQLPSDVKDAINDLHSRGAPDHPLASNLLCPKFFFEALIEQPSNPSVDQVQKGLLVFRPVALYESEFLDPSWRDQFGGSRNLAITLTMNRAGSDATLASVLMPFRDIGVASDKPFFVGPDYFQAVTSKPFTAPPLDGDEKAKLDSIITEWPEYLKYQELAKQKTVPADPWALPPRSVKGAYESARVKFCKDFADAKLDGVSKPLECQELPKNLVDQQTKVTGLKATASSAAAAEEDWRTAKHLMVDLNSAKKQWPHLDCSRTDVSKQVSCNVSLTALYATMSVTVLETREQSAFDRFLTQVATNVQSSLDTAIANQAPDKKAAAVDQRKQDEADYEAAKIDVESAQAALDAATGDAAKVRDAKKDLITKKATANKLARKLGQPEYPIP